MAIYGALGESARGDIRGSTSSASSGGRGVGLGRSDPGCSHCRELLRCSGGHDSSRLQRDWGMRGGNTRVRVSFTGFPVGQTTAVSLYLYDGPETTGTQIANVGSTGIETVLWNPRSSDFGPGSHVIAAHIGSSGISALNLTPVPNWPITNSYNVTLPHCGSGTPSFVGLASTPDSGGYWQTTSDGQVLAFGDARWFGSMSGTPLNCTPSLGSQQRLMGVAIGSSPRTEVCLRSVTRSFTAQLAASD